MLGTILGWAIKIISVLPNLIVNIEQLWSGVPKSGAQKWISIEQALSGAIEAAATATAKLAPAGTKPETISAAIVKFAKATNDAFVLFCNETGIFATTSTTPKT